MITVAMSTVIDAERGRVWRALADADERARWDAALLAPVDAAVRDTTGSGPGCAKGWVRWRYRLGSVQTVMRERVVERVAPERLRSEVAIGSFCYARTFSLDVDPAEPSRTRLSMKLVSSSAIPLVGNVVDRFEVRRLVSERIDATLRAVQQWCERAQA